MVDQSRLDRILKMCILLSPPTYFGYRYIPKIGLRLEKEIGNLDKSN